MSATTTPAEEVVARLSAVYGDPKTPDPAMFVDEYIKALTGFDGRVLHRAADRVIKSSMFWPRPAELIAEIDDVSWDTGQKPEFQKMQRDSRNVVHRS